MTIGLVILGVSAVLLFFGAAEKYFDRLGLTSWLAFLLILALIVGAVTPEIRTENFVMTVGGFVVPLVVSIVLFALASRQGSMLRTLLAVILVTSSTIIFRLIFDVTDSVMLLVSNLLIGFVGGALGALGAGSRLGALAGGMGGVVLGDLISALTQTYIFGSGTFALGGGIFDGVIIATAFGLIVAEVTQSLRKREDNLAVSPVTEAEVAEDEKMSVQSLDVNDAEFSEEEIIIREEDDRL
ncbi:MAG: hypothetical protein IJX05_02005 [Clostridia bacterium]|nr:hypothetical protein [Clostridia bacterium]